MIISKHRRTKVTRSHARKRVHKKPPPVQQPDAVVLSYSKLLLAEVKRLQEMVDTILLPNLSFLTTRTDAETIKIAEVEVLDKDHDSKKPDSLTLNKRGQDVFLVERLDDIDVTAKIAGLFHRMKMKFFGEAGHGHEPKLINYTRKITNKIVKPMLGRANEHNKRQFSKGMQTVLNVDPLKAEPFLRDQVALATKANVDLIKTIPKDYFHDIEGLVTHAARSGESIDTLRDKIVDKTSATNNRARVIARDQISKFNGALHQERAKNNGITRYIWHTVRDQRVRSDHDVLDGKTFFWNDPPIIVRSGKMSGEKGHPGTGIMCRCYSENIWEDLIDGGPVEVKPKEPTQKERINTIENDVRYKKDVERAVVIDKDGNTLVDKTGSKNQVGFTRDELKTMKGNILTHNHPSGTSFSSQDVSIAVKTDMAEIRAVGSEYKYSATFDNSKIPGETTKEKAEHVKKQYNMVRGQVRTSFWKKINKGEVTFAEAEAATGHEIMTKFANGRKRKEWVTYERQGWKTQD